MFQTTEKPSYKFWYLQIMEHSAAIKIMFQEDMFLHNDVYSTWVEYIYIFYKQNVQYNSDFVKEKWNRVNRLG